MDSLTEAIDPVLMRAKARVGKVLKEKWRLDVLIGVGGMAAVYAATHRNGDRVAIKLLHPELSTHGHVRTRFLREAYIANQVGHPGVVRVIDDDIAEDGSIFLVMDLLDGESLEERRERSGGRLDPDEVLAATDQVLDVLIAAHDKGIIHRDIKPENVFLTRDGKVRVLDFGIARLREFSTATAATHEGTTLGTPSYMAPEHARGLWEEVDARSDVFSVGAMMFMLATGKVPHEGRTVNEQLLSAMTKSAPSVASMRASVPAPAASVIDKALGFRKEERWADARTMQDALRRAYHKIHGSPISTRPRLIVPVAVPNRTLPSAGVDVAVIVGPGTTGAAVVEWTGRAMRTITTLPRAFVAASALGIAVLVVFAIVLVRHEVKSGKQVPSPTGSPLAVVEIAPDLGDASVATGSMSVQPAAEPTAPTPQVIELDQLPTSETDKPKLPTTSGSTDASAKRGQPPKPPPGDWMENRR